MASTLIRPSPGMAKITSTMNAPASMCAQERPTTVTTGIIAGLSACSAMTARSERPLARADVAREQTSGMRTENEGRQNHGFQIEQRILGERHVTGRRQDREQHTEE